MSTTCPTEPHAHCVGESLERRLRTVIEDELRRYPHYVGVISVSDVATDLIPVLVPLFAEQEATRADVGSPSDVVVLVPGLIGRLEAASECPD